MGGGINGVT